MLHELRIYTVMPGRMPAVLERFGGALLQLWEQHGIHQVGFWTPVIGGNSSDLYYLLQWRDLAEREQRWAAFAADPQWARIKQASEADGVLVGNIRNLILAPTAFSALR
jgi:NIPSNAP